MLETCSPAHRILRKSRDRVPQISIFWTLNTGRCRFLRETRWGCFKRKPKGNRLCWEFPSPSPNEISKNAARPPLRDAHPHPHRRRLDFRLCRRHALGALLLAPAQQVPGAVGALPAAGGQMAMGFSKPAVSPRHPISNTKIGSYMGAPKTPWDPKTVQNRQIHAQETQASDSPVPTRNGPNHGFSKCYEMDCSSPVAPLKLTGV